MKDIQAKISKYKLIQFLFGLFGVVLSLALWWYKVRNVLPPCTVSGCSHVLTGEYSELYQTPVAVLGLFFYTILSLLIFEGIFIKHKLIQNLTLYSLLAGWIFTLYLRYLEFVKIGKWCEWCWMSVLFLLIITISFVLELRQSK